MAPIVKEIYANASSLIKKPVTLNKLVSEIEKLDWYSAREEELGDLYEGLLQKNAEEKKSGAGQYFTPQPLIDSMVAVMQPTLEDVIQDPAAGTGGFPIAALHWIREHHDISELDEKQQKKFYERRFYGMEHVQDTHRLLERLAAKKWAAHQAEAAAGKPSRRGRRPAAANPVPSPVDAAPVTPDQLASLLRECGALSERALLAASELDPASFKAQLAHERSLGAIGNVVDDGQELLGALG
jgi:hypothetical protein